MSKPDYDTSLARMAGNIASGLMSQIIVKEWKPHNGDWVADVSIDVADRIIRRLKARALAREKN